MVCYKETIPQMLRMFFVSGLAICSCSIEIPTRHCLPILCIQVETLTQTDNFNFDDKIKKNQQNT